jgi:HlyD family secretion protein
MIRRLSLGLALLLAAAQATAQERSTAPGQPASAQSVSALGRLEPEYGIVRVSASSTPQAILGAILVELHVDEGDDVEAGQLLAVTDTAAVMDALVVEAEASLEYARQEVVASRSQATEACVRADVAQREAERRVRLHEQGVAGEEEADSARGEAEAQRASCASASAAVQLAESGVHVALAHLDRARAEARRSYIHAPFAGRVLEIVARPGELIGETGILELGRVSRMYAIAEVYETDIRLVAAGQRATVSSPALDRPLTGTVQAIRPKVAKQDEIGTDPAARKDARIVEVPILLDEPEPAAGLTNLQVDVVIEH